MPTRRTDRQVSEWTRGEPKRNAGTRGKSLKKVKQLQKKAAEGKKEEHQETVEKMRLGRGGSEAEMAKLLKTPGKAGKEKPVVAKRPPMPNESGRSDLMRRGGKKRGLSE